MQIYEVSYVRATWKTRSSTVLEAENAEDAKKRMLKLDKGSVHPIKKSTVRVRLNRRVNR